MAINLIKPLAFLHFKATESEQLIKDGGGLFVRIRPIANGGGVSFRLAYRFEGKQKWADFKAKTLPEAREERDAFKALLKTGVDPKLEIKIEKARKKQQQLEELEAFAKLKARMTVNDLFCLWCDTDLIYRKDKSEVIRMFNKDVLPDMGYLFIEDVKKGHVSSIIIKLKKRGVIHLARNILKLIRQMFRFAVDSDFIEFDPTASLSITKTTTKPTERDRYLTELEIKALARQLPDARLMKSTECALWIALSTMCRIGELSKAKFSDIDFAEKIWFIPKENSKNKNAHTIYLSEFALGQFKLLATYANNDIWVFPNRDRTSHVCKKSITKQVDGRQNTQILSNRSKNNQTLVLSGGKWTPHDLRRSGSTLLGEMVYDADLIEKMLNHTEENRTKRTYQRQKLEKQKKEAWHALGQRLQLLTNTESSNVILMPLADRV
ncbi:MAG: tyrosine-type recombinase/integrase [Methylococcales bacterium]